MSVNSNKITIYSSPQAEHLTACSVAESTVNHVPKRTIYRVKVSSSKDLEVLSSAAKHGLSTWVGGQKVRIVGVAQKQLSEFATAKSCVSTPQSLMLSSGETANSFASCQAVCHGSSGTNDIYSTSSEKSTLHEGCWTASVAGMSDAESCSSSTCSNAGDIQPECFVSSTASQSCTTSGYGCQASLKAAVDTGMSVRQYSSAAVKSSVKPWSDCESDGRSLMLQGLHRGVHYLGTIAVNSQNITVGSAKQDSSTGLHKSFSEAAVISAVKRLTECTSGSKLSHGNQLSTTTVRCIKNNHVDTSHQPVNCSKTSLAIVGSCLKRHYTDDDTTVVSPKRMSPSVTCSLGYAKVNSCSDASSSGTHRQPLTANMLNHVEARLSSCNQHQYAVCNDYSANDSVKNGCWTVKVKNNDSTQQRLLSNLVPKLRLPSGSGWQSYIILILLYFNVYKTSVPCLQGGPKKRYQFYFCDNFRKCTPF